MTDQSNTLSEYQLDLDKAIQMAIEQLPVDLEATDRSLVDAISCWDEVEGRQFWVMHWLNEKQLSRRRFLNNTASDLGQRRAPVKGGGDMKVTVSSNGQVSYVLSR